MVEKRSVDINIVYIVMKIKQQTCFLHSFFFLISLRQMHIRIKNVLFKRQDVYKSIIMPQSALQYILRVRFFFFHYTHSFTRPQV